jgi:hypothetical protein
MSTFWFIAIVVQEDACSPVWQTMRRLFVNLPYKAHASRKQTREPRVCTLGSLMNHECAAHADQANALGPILHELPQDLGVDR